MRAQIVQVFFAAMVILNEDRDLSWTGVKQSLGHGERVHATTRSRRSQKRFVIRARLKP